MAGDEIKFNVDGNQFLLKVGQVISDISNSNLKQIISLFDNGDDQIDGNEFKKLKEQEKRINSILKDAQRHDTWASKVEYITGISQKESIWLLNDSQNLVNKRRDSQPGSHAYEYDSSGNLINYKYQADNHLHEFEYEYDEKGNRIKTKTKEKVANNDYYNSEIEYDKTEAPVYKKTIEKRDDGSARTCVEKYFNDDNGNEILRIIDEDGNGTVDAIIPIWQRFSSR